MDSNGKPADGAVQEELNRILESQEFSGSGRLKSFLRFVVERTLSGHASEVKESVIAVEVYNKSGDYNPKTDATVRVEASRLRVKLRTYYANEGKDDRVVISVPVGGYVPSFETSQKDVEGAPLSSGRGSSLRALKWIALTGLVAAGGSAILWRARTPLPEPRLVPVTTLPGIEAYPALSPDGSQVAFSWSAGAPGTSLENWDIYVKQVDGNAMLRLTTDPSPERAPAWSPDGAEVAFFRGDRDIFIVPAIGGRERHVFSRLHTAPSRLAWTPDGSALLYADRTAERSEIEIWHLTIATGHRRKLTSPPAGSGGDAEPVVSPDGEYVVYSRALNTSTRELRMISIKGDDDRRLVSGNSLGAAWTPGGELIFASSTPHDRAQAPTERLFRMNVFGPSRGQPQWIRVAGERAASPTVGGGKFGKPVRIVFQQATLDADLWRSNQQDGRFSAPRKVASSTRQETAPRVSPGGDRIAFVSDRSGSQELWVAQADGENPLQLTHFAPAAVNLPSWSPDGRRLIFNSRKDSNNNNLFVISAEGGAPQQITSHTANEAFGSWSRDGRWIYFSSDRSGTEQVWKMNSEGGEAVQLTKGGGYRPFEAPDGRVVFTKYFDERLWSIDSDGAKESLLTEVKVRDFAVIDSGVLFVEPRGGPNLKLKLLRPANGRTEPFGDPIELPAGVVEAGFSASSSGRQLVFVGRKTEVDLMLIEGFH